MGNPLPPIVSNTHFPGNHANDAPDEAKGLTWFPKVSNLQNSRAREGGFTGNPPTPQPGGLEPAGPEHKGGLGSQPPVSIPVIFFT
jgi:hypothetical protein